RGPCRTSRSSVLALVYMHPPADAIVHPPAGYVGWQKRRAPIAPQMHLRARLCPRDRPGGRNSLVLRDGPVGNGKAPLPTLRLLPIDQLTSADASCRRLWRMRSILVVPA